MSRRREGSSTPRFSRNDNSSSSRSNSRGSGRYSRVSDDGPRGRPRRESSDNYSRGGRSRPSERSSREAPVMHAVTCDKCKKRCEVPFLPSSNKPVYCSDCFRKDGDSKTDQFESQLSQVNKKLDIIIKGLDL